MKRLSIAFFAGAAIASFPSLMEGIAEQSGWLAAVYGVCRPLLMPGFVVALAVAGGRLDDLSFSVLFIANVVSYSAVAYILLLLAEKLLVLKASGVGRKPTQRI
jgi:hypothetical protein